MNGEVQVVSRREHTFAESLARSRYALRFPKHWRAEPVCNPAEHAIEQGTIAWLGTYDIGRGPSEREKLRKFECGRYGGYSLPTAPFEEALLITQFISLWLFWDDVEVEDHTRWSIDDVVAALLSGDGGQRGRYVAAWADLGRRLGERRSAAWLEQLTASMRHWLENAQRETRLARRLRDRGEWPELDELFGCRTVSIGMYPTFYLIELAEAIELPSEFHEHPVVLSLKRTASRLVGLGNDLGGLAKDLRNQWLNLAIVLGRSSSLSLDAAFSQLVELHNQEVLEFDRTAQQLPAFGAALAVHVQRWLLAVRYSVYGFALWESMAERYQEFTALVDGHALLAPVAEAQASSVSPSATDLQ